MPRALQTLVDLVSELPGIGPRQARRIVQFLLRSSPRYVAELSAAIAAVQKHVSQCAQCFRFDEVNGAKLCPLCADASRTNEIVMVVEKDVDVDGLESSGIYRGRYFVLGALMPLGVKRKSTVSPRSADLKRIVKKLPGLKEVVLAFATTPEGDYTASELKKMLTDENPLITVSMLGRGLSLGAEIEYADHETLRSAFFGRH